MLKLTNKHRALHGSRPLRWNATLAATAKLWSKQCTIEHSQGKYLDGQYGENTYYRFGSLPSGLQDCTAAETYWYNEVRNYNWLKPGEKINPRLIMVLHFTQVVWADTRSMGCGTTSCRDGSSYTICHYYPQGNFKWCNWDTGKCYSYRENVFRTACQNMTRNDGCSKCSKKVYRPSHCMAYLPTPTKTQASTASASPTAPAATAAPKIEGCCLRRRR
ncbi:hypothetical protein CHLNCDRAFT_139641 [Chlorella variabilis]|uniref:SCP domain-containing protein n=1 Tax=Chlorella variabilis TaxID=554065 RepID=E1ZQL5_CHLVA|nr:hypothetical protein CHLNCDRAFT_139641 [Chlorella variabilis]EFN51963.1 hypothetical protein CHLNCDRAFT_139641 [Chlorella variabilis]|eukprot:XP_005844065.1 hypothetical protein CHLNCDRAFT_139641 [Chlorella variabilis]